jgi:uncharacterized RDD family membrane protein YckC
LPHLPDPDSHDSVVERRCAGCGSWNHAAEARCQRCGRKLETMLGAEGRHELEETESLPGPSLAAAVTPRPVAAPQWKEELNQRLAGYRERKAAYEETAEIARPEGERPRPSLPTRASRPSLASAPPPGAYSPLPVKVRVAEPQEESPRIRRLPEPPIVDRLLHEQSQLPAPRPRPRVEDLLAPIKFRFIAGLLDLCVVALALGVFLLVMHLTDPAILASPDNLAIAGGAFATLLIIYWVGYLRLMGSTAGMIWTGLRVLNLDAEPPDTQQRWTRALGTVLSAAALGVGFLWSLFDEQHFTWHDRVSKTFVGLDG